MNYFLSFNLGKEMGITRFLIRLLNLIILCTLNHLLTELFAELT